MRMLHAKMALMIERSRAIWIIGLLLCLALYIGRVAHAQTGVTPPLRAGEREIPFQNLVVGMYGGGERRANLVISAPNEWRRVWNVYNETLIYKLPLLQVDFRQKVVLAVLLGNQLAADRNVYVVKVVRGAREVVVYYVIKQGITKDAEGMTIVSTSQPFNFVAIDKQSLAIRFVKTLDSAVENGIIGTVGAKDRASIVEGDAGGTHTGTLYDLANGEAVATREDLIAVSKGERSGIRLLADSSGQNRIATNFAWVLVCGFLTLMLQVGLVMWQCGFVRGKHQTHALSLNLLALSLGTTAFWAAGFALMSGATDSIEALGRTAILSGGNKVSIGHVGSLFATSGWLLSGNHYDVATGALFLL